MDSETDIKNVTEDLGLPVKEVKTELDDYETSEPESSPQSAPIVESDQAASPEEKTEAVAGQDGAAKQVPLAALQDERTKRQALELKLKTLTERFDQVIDAMAAGKKPAQEPEQQQIPDWTVDPLGHLRTSLGILAEEVKKISQGSQQRDQREAQHSQETVLSNRWMADIHLASTAKPDFMEAVAFLAKVRTEELSTLGYNQDEITRILSTEAKDLAERSYKEMEDTGQRYNAAEKLYTLAKLRGYGATSETKAQPKKDPKTVRGVNSSSKSAPPVITAEFIDSMTEEEYGEFMKGRDWRRMHLS